MTPQCGDVMKVVKGPYAHYAASVWPGSVLEFTGDAAKDLATARVRISSFESFAAGGTVQLEYRPTAEQMVGFWDRVHEVLHRTDYNLFANNCEHIARFVATGTKASRQVQAAALIAGGILLWKLLPDEDEDDE